MEPIEPAGSWCFQHQWVQWVLQQN